MCKKISTKIFCNKLSNKKILKIFFLQILLGGCASSVVVVQKNATDASAIAPETQITDSTQNQLSDSTDQTKDTNYVEMDTNGVENRTDSMEIDSTVRKLRTSPNAVTTIVDYFAKDSVEFDISNSMSILYSQTELNYEDVNLQSNYVEVNFLKKELFASGETDTAGTLHGNPVFKQEGYEFKCHELQYNFDTKKGLIRNIITQEGESYIHGELVKKNEDNTSYIYRGKYTTCNLECPHFEAGFKKAKVIPNDKIITGPVWVRIASVPIVPLPFGFFPNSNKRQNGLLMPKNYGLREATGPYLEGIGYYFAIKDKVDFSITTTLFMRGGFGIGLESHYAKRYKFTGNYNIAYTLTPKGEKTVKEGPDAYSQMHDIRVYWSHQQDRRAHPVNNFSANVDFKTSTYAKNNVERSISDYTQSKAMSTVNFSTSFKGKYSLGVNAALSQDLREGDLDMNLPQINFGISQFYPFRRKQTVGKLRWYENISMQYTMDFQNMINTKDSILINATKYAFNNMRTGMSHNIPIKSTIKILKHINWENSANFRESWQIKGVKQSWGEYDSLARTNVHKDTMYGFFPAHDLSLSSGLSTTLYGMYTMKKGRVYAFRHTLTPAVNFTYRPAINKSLYDTYDKEIVNTYYDSINDTHYDSISYEKERYSYIDGSLYGAPVYKASGMINFSISNKLEMKVRSKKEDDETFKKVTLLENLTISTGYDLLADSLNWDPLRISGRTILFKQINVDFNLAFDPYIIGEKGKSINKTVLKDKKHLYRFSSAGTGISFSYDIDKNLFNKKEEREKKESPSGFGDWRVSVSYIFSYNTNDNGNYYRLDEFGVRMDSLKYTKNFNNSVSLNANFNLTPKWSLTVRQFGYNFTQKSLNPCEFEVERDLHCWTIHFVWVPWGYYRGFEFRIRAKASILQDAKLDQKRQYND